MQGRERLRVQYGTAPKSTHRGKIEARMSYSIFVPIAALASPDPYFFFNRRRAGDNGRPCDDTDAMLGEKGAVRATRFSFIVGKCESSH